MSPYCRFKGRDLKHPYCVGCLEKGSCFIDKAYLCCLEVCICIGVNNPGWGK